jgi:predicted lysophospholipase L1 biosynthesis ABC-type transport system permease subunit
VLGQLYEPAAGLPAVGEDLIYEERLLQFAVGHSEDFGAAGIVVGGVVGAAVGIGLAIVLPPTLPNVDFGGWSIALAVGGILAGGAVGGVVGSFAGLPDAEPDPADVLAQSDPFEHKVLPFLIPPFLVIVIAAIITTFGSGLLQLGKSELEIGPIVIAKAVLAALGGIVVIGFGALWLASREDQSPPSRRETVSHRAEH